MDLFRQERNSSKLKNLLVIAEISAIVTIVVSLANYLWENTQISSIDQSLQVAFLGSFALLSILAANYVINRRW